ncbi:DUF938 domain-containing protein, partial [Pseudomonadota bacterium]
SMEAVVQMFTHASEAIKPGGQFIIYGPFMYDGKHTAPSNERFDRWNRAWVPTRGIRDVTWLKEIAEKNRFYLKEDIDMPANNRILIWYCKQS